MGEWTRVECLCAGDSINVLVNGVTMNECFGVYPVLGKIRLQSEGFKILSRNLELQTLKKKSGDSD